MVKKAHARAAATGRYVAAGFSLGLAQMVAVSGVTPHRPYPSTDRTDAEALRGDWERLNSDMKAAATTVAEGAERR